MVDRMRRELLRNSPTLVRDHSLSLIASALLVALNARALHAQSLRPYTLSGAPERAGPAPTAPFRLELNQAALSGYPSLTALAPFRAFSVQVPAASTRKAVVPAHVAGPKTPSLECPMPIARADSSHSQGMPVMRTDSAAALSDNGGTLLGCTNPLAR